MWEYRTGCILKIIKDMYCTVKVEVGTVNDSVEIFCSFLSLETNFTCSNICILHPLCGSCESLNKVHAELHFRQLHCAWIIIIIAIKWSTSYIRDNPPYSNPANPANARKYSLMVSYLGKKPPLSPDSAYLCFRSSHSGTQEFAAMVGDWGKC